MRIGFFLIAVALGTGAAFGQIAEDIEIEVPNVSSRTAPTHPLDLEVNIKMRNGSLKRFLEEVGRQVGLYFDFAEVVDCQASAFVRGLTARQALQITFETGAATYQQIGRSNTYTITGPHGSSYRCDSKPAAPAGDCEKSGNKPISIKCKDGALWQFAEFLVGQSDANLFLWDGAGLRSISVKLKGATIDEALRKAIKDRSLQVSTVNTSGAIIVKPSRED